MSRLSLFYIQLFLCQFFSVNYAAAAVAIYSAYNYSNIQLLQLFKSYYNCHRSFNNKQSYLSFYTVTLVPGNFLTWVVTASLNLCLSKHLMNTKLCHPPSLLNILILFSHFTGSRPLALTASTLLLMLEGSCIHMDQCTFQKDCQKMHSKIGDILKGITTQRIQCDTVKSF